MDAKRIKAFLKIDAYASFVFKDLTSSGLDENTAHNVIYSMILDNPGMKSAYDKM